MFSVSAQRNLNACQVSDSSALICAKSRKLSILSLFYIENALKCVKKNVIPFGVFAVFKNSARKMEQNSEGKHAGCVAYGGTFLLDMHLQVCVWSETD